MTDKYSDEDKQTKDDKTYDPSRRRFLKNTGMVAGGVVGGSFLGGLLPYKFIQKNETATKSGMEHSTDFQEALWSDLCRYDHWRRIRTTCGYCRGLLDLSFQIRNYFYYQKSESHTIRKLVKVLSVKTLRAISQIYLLLSGARGFFEEKKFNLYMGTGSLGSTLDDFAGDNEDHTNLNYLHGFEIHFSQLGARPISNNQVPVGTPTWGKEF